MSVAIPGASRVDWFGNKGVCPVLRISVIEELWHLGSTWLDECFLGSIQGDWSAISYFNKSVWLSRVSLEEMRRKLFLLTLLLILFQTFPLLQDLLFLAQLLLLSADYFSNLIFFVFSNRFLALLHCLSKYVFQVLIIFITFLSE